QPRARDRGAHRPGDSRAGARRGRDRGDGLRGRGLRARGAGGRMSEFWPAPTAADRAAYADAEVRPYWLAALAPRDPAPPVSGTVHTELCIVGGGFTGLWAALH